MMDFSEIKRQVLAASSFGALQDQESEHSRVACLNLHLACFALTDFGRVAESLPFYAEDFTGVLDGMELDHAANARFIRQRQADVARRTRHVCSNYLFRRASPDAAYALSLVTVYLEDERRQPGVNPLTVADCAEQYVRSAEGRWQIRYRYLRPVAGAPR